MNSRGNVTQAEIMITLMQLERDLEKERLDCARPLIESLRHALVRDAKMLNTPPGILSVQGWISLLGRWEEDLTHIPARRMRFVRGFFQELQERADVTGSPIGMAIDELSGLIEVQFRKADALAAA
ncbi:hypothetical protein SIID45300_00674 [Candidatus Magnetaquicoccaceae bacterium FCR-1]|uniref:Uncharacterized protein n=1 Tax=Candidatus Magnetaquiglobus chichijimensis TaxID=3141448 RepID=A0ABQ0C652_9PROT